MSKPVPPPSRLSNPLNVFMAQPANLSDSSSMSPLPSLSRFSTCADNRFITADLVTAYVSPVLPIPSPQASPDPSATSPRLHTPFSSKAVHATPQTTFSPPPPTAPPLPHGPDSPQSVLSAHSQQNHDSDSEFDHEHSSRRFSVRDPSAYHSVRHSIRVPSQHPQQEASLAAWNQNTSSWNAGMSPNAKPNMTAVPVPSSLSPPLLSDLFSDSTSFLNFSEDHRMTSLASPSVVLSSANGVPFSDEPDTFDTFATLSHHPPSAAILSPSAPSAEKLVHPMQKSSEVACDGDQDNPTSPEMPPDVSTTQADHDDEDGTLDIPDGLTSSPAASRAIRELQRASITAANELVESIRLMDDQAIGHSVAKGDDPGYAKFTDRLPTDGIVGVSDDGCKKLQGQLLLRSRFLRRWNLRYATVIQQAYFGPVLLLFRPDSKPGLSSSMSLKSSKMVALAHATVVMQDAPRKHNGAVIHLFDMTTSQRTYTFACSDPGSRTHWVHRLTSFISGKAPCLKQTL